jgi:hypothetical protein
LHSWTTLIRFFDAVYPVFPDYVLPDEDGREQAGMGSTVGDYDNDARPDIFKTNFSDDTSSLYHNNGDGTFSSAISE